MYTKLRLKDLLTQEYFWIVASVADIAAGNLNGKKKDIARGVSTLYINGKPAVINILRKLKNPPPWTVIFLVVPFKKNLFSKELITFIISFSKLFFRVIPVSKIVGPAKMFLESGKYFLETSAILLFAV